MLLLRLYAWFAFLITPLLWLLLRLRLAKGKEVRERVSERRGISLLPRPDGQLIWFHAASVGEAQSTLILIDLLLKSHPDSHVLVTTGTVTSAEIMAAKLPDRAVHQFYPLDQPFWVNRFLNHWSPDCVMWMESELWPNMLRAIKQRSIPAVLMNGRMSKKSAKNWSYFKKTAQYLLSTFDQLLVQSSGDYDAFQTLGAENIHIVGNLKFGASPLPYDIAMLKSIKGNIKKRPVWLYASTHDGEEQLAIDTHQKLLRQHPDLLTIIVPRHPERRGDIKELCNRSDINYGFRSDGDDVSGVEVYIADTLGELGLFYKLCAVSVIGRSFSHDGGGGHNPIEAAQLGSAVLTGPNIQYQREIFDDMLASNAAHMVKNKDELSTALHSLLTNQGELKALQGRGRKFVDQKNGIVHTAYKQISPLIDKALSS